MAAHAPRYSLPLQAGHCCSHWLQHHWQAATAPLAADPASSIMKQCMVTTHHTVHHA